MKETKRSLVVYYNPFKNIYPSWLLSTCCFIGVPYFVLTLREEYRLMIFKKRRVLRRIFGS